MNYKKYSQKTLDILKRNMEQRRVADEMIDKLKMRDLPNYKILDEVKDDGYGHPKKFSLIQIVAKFLYRKKMK